MKKLYELISGQNYFGYASKRKSKVLFIIFFMYKLLVYSMLPNNFVGSYNIYAKAIRKYFGQFEFCFIQTRDLFECGVYIRVSNETEFSCPLGQRDRSPFIVPGPRDNGTEVHSLSWNNRTSTKIGHRTVREEILISCYGMG